MRGGCRRGRRECVDRYTAFDGGSIPPLKGTNDAGDASIASYVAQQMLEESGVRLLLSTFVADPILEGNRVGGSSSKTNPAGRRSWQRW